MPNITLTDDTKLQVNATILDKSKLGKTAGSVLHFLRDDVVHALDQPLDQVQINSVSLGFSYQPQIPIDLDVATFCAGGGPGGELDLYPPSAGLVSALFPHDPYATGVPAAKHYYLALQLALKAGGTLKDEPPPFTLTLAAGAEADAKFYLPFSPGADGKYPTLKTGIEAVFNAWTIPSSLEKAVALPQDAITLFSAEGHVSFSAEVDLLAAVNPTASPGFAQTWGPISVSAGPSVTLGGSYAVSGSFKVRVWKKSATTVQLAYYKQRGSTFSVTFDASAGVDVEVGKFDVIAKIYNLLGDSGTLSDDWLKKNIPDAVAKQVEDAYETAAQTKLSIALDEECDATLNDQAAFVWEFDTTATDAAAVDAFDHALKGNLTTLTGGGALPKGVTKTLNVLETLSETKHTFTFNFLGLFDYASVQDAALKTVVKASDDGQVVVTDTATILRLQATATPFVKSDQLRKALAENFVATMGYASSSGKVAAQLKLNYDYYRYQSAARVTDLAAYVSLADAVLGAGTADADWSATATAGLGSQAGSLLTQLSYAPGGSSALFLDGTGTPRKQSDYESAGRLALLQTPGLDLGRFRPIAGDPEGWQSARDTGSRPSFLAFLGVDVQNPPMWASLSYTLMIHIADWSAAMASAARALRAITDYLAAHPTLDLQKDDGFATRRKAFAGQIKSSMDKAPIFGTELGVLLLEKAAPPAQRNATIRYGGRSKSYSA